MSNELFKTILKYVVVIIAIVIVINLVIGTYFIFSHTKRTNEFLNNRAPVHQFDAIFVN